MTLLRQLITMQITRLRQLSRDYISDILVLVGRRKGLSLEVRPSNVNRLLKNVWIPEPSFTYESWVLIRLLIVTLEVRLVVRNFLMFLLLKPSNLPAMNLVRPISKTKCTHTRPHVCKGKLLAHGPAAVNLHRPINYL